jgi:hypothetical protein
LTDKITKLIAQEFIREKETTVVFPAGFKFVYLVEIQRLVKHMTLGLN